MTITEAAHELGLTYQQTRDAMFARRLTGCQILGRWAVTRKSVAALKRAS